MPFKTQMSQSDDSWMNLMPVFTFKIIECILAYIIINQTNKTLCDRHHHQPTDAPGKCCYGGRIEMSSYSKQSCALHPALGYTAWGTGS